MSSPFTLSLAVALTLTLTAGALLGLTLHHSRAHVWRAALEAICLGTKASLLAPTLTLTLTPTPTLALTLALALALALALINLPISQAPLLLLDGFKAIEGVLDSGRLG